MKIVHICLNAGYSEGFCYQENYLAKYHVLAGNDVTVIASQYCWHENKWGLCTKSNFYDHHGVYVIRLPYKYKLTYKLNIYFGSFLGFDSLLYEINPDIIFIHNLQFQDIKHIALYKKKNLAVRIYVDNHADYFNSASNWLSKNILHRIIWRYYAHIINPYVIKFYGVLPARVDFLKKMYKLPANKCELLLMGADDEKVKEARKPEKRQEIRKKHGILINDFLIMTGGKINHWRIQTFLLMEAVAKITDPKVKLIVFGSVEPELEERLASLLITDKVLHIGWINPEQVCHYFAAAELVVFPGAHSVFWEQVTGLGIPMICKYWNGITHVDLGGNVIFIYEDSVEAIGEKILDVTGNLDLYHKMKMIAETRGTEVFSYKRIAAYSIK